MISKSLFIQFNLNNDLLTRTKFTRGYIVFIIQNIFLMIIHSPLLNGTSRLH